MNFTSQGGTALKLRDVIRKARKTHRDTMNKIEAIKSIRMARPDVGLKGAKDFWDWIDAYDYIPATTLVGLWCEGHWCEPRNCGCAASPSAAGAGAVGGSKPVLENASSEHAPSERRTKLTVPSQPGASAPALIEANKDRCPCGRKPCMDEFHAHLAALIRKYGSTRAVELVWIASGVVAPENEEQERYVESLPGYKRLYKEQQQ
jgi:hypothetical protein